MSFECSEKGRIKYVGPADGNTVVVPSCGPDKWKTKPEDTPVATPSTSPAPVTAPKQVVPPPEVKPQPPAETQVVPQVEIPPAPVPAPPVPPGIDKDAWAACWADPTSMQCTGEAATIIVDKYGSVAKATKKTLTHIQDASKGVQGDESTHTNDPSFKSLEDYWSSVTKDIGPVGGAVALGVGTAIVIGLIYLAVRRRH